MRALSQRAKVADAAFRRSRRPALSETAAGSSERSRLFAFALAECDQFAARTNA